MKKLANGKVELEIGDKISTVFNARSEVYITEFIYNSDAKLRLKCGETLNLQSCEYYVNDILYSKNQIVVPKPQPSIQFENEQHERLHNALIKAGFTYDNKREYNRCNWKHGYYNNYLGQLICWDYFKNKLILVRDSCWNNEYELDQKPIQTIIDHYESLIKEKIVQEFQPITPENIVKVVEYNGFESEHFTNYYKHDDFGYAKENDAFRFWECNSHNLIVTTSFDEFLAFVQKRIELKPLPKELSLLEWFDKLKSGFELNELSCWFDISKGGLSTLGYIKKDLPRPQQEELILKIIEIYGGVE